MLFNELQLHAKLLKAVDAAGFTSPTPIQEQAIPVILAGRDLMASAQTGTGKTAAFVLPILHRLLEPSPGSGSKGPRVLVLTPTRELATQVDDDIRKFCRFVRLKAGSVVGGVGYGPQIRMLNKPLDLLVATPGRLMDHMAEGRVDLSKLKVLVLDEADRMLDMGFVRDVRKIVAMTPDTRQTLLFSATLEGQVLSMANEVMRDPALIQLTTNTRRHENIRQLVHQADDAAHKQELLAHHLTSDTLTQALIFTRTKRRAERLATQLSRDGHDCAALHGDMRQAARRRVVDSMRAGKLRVLVATDVAARGLDIRGISHVINFDMPMVAEDYIHRIGRTGRAGATGTAVSLVGPEDWELFTSIRILTGFELAREIVPGLGPSHREPQQRSGRMRTARPGRPQSYDPRRGPQRGSPSSKPKHGGGNGRRAHFRRRRDTAA